MKEDAFENDDVWGTRAKEGKYSLAILGNYARYIQTAAVGSTLWSFEMRF
jgi:hypothetical protein